MSQTERIHQIVHLLENSRQPVPLARFLDELDEDAQACVMVLHDPALAVRLCSHLLMLFSDGTYLQGETGKIATTENLSRLYGNPFQAVSTDIGPVFYPG